jgi:hypothetical protein
METLSATANATRPNATINANQWISNNGDD